MDDCPGYSECAWASRETCAVCPLKDSGRTLGTFVSLGFTLGTPDDHVVVLLHDGERIAVFSQTGATRSKIQEECAKHLVFKHGWTGELWQSAR